MFYVVTSYSYAHTYIAVCPGGPLHDGSYLTPADLAGLRQSAASPDTSPMAAMLRDAAVSGAAGHFGGAPPPSGPLHGPPFSRYPGGVGGGGLRHQGSQQTQLAPPPPNSGPSVQPQPAVEVAAEIW